MRRRFPRAWLAAALVAFALAKVARGQQAAALQSLPEAPGQKSAASPPGGDSEPKSPPKISRKKSQRSSDSYQLLPGEDPDNRLGAPFLKHLAMDQKSFWVTPAHLKIRDLRWIVPLASGTAILIASDSWLSKQVPNSPSQISRSKSISDYGAYSLIGLGGASYLFGHFTRNDHLSETGLLSAEAAIDATAVAYAFKFSTQRPRPYQGNQHGSFFQGGYSFPSEHSAIAWSIASTWAHEYPGPLSQILAYGLASTVTLTRVTARQHFPSDVVLGSALGWYFGREVYRAHHDPELGGAPWGGLLPEKTGEKVRSPENMGSADVPLDSWVYPALERLAALGYIQTAYLGIRPWTRLECARLLSEAEDRIPDDAAQNNEAAKIYSALDSEFQPEMARLDGAANVGATVDSIYTRVTNISGQPLADGYHFGQTIINDYGRPYWQGFNAIAGFSAHADAGPFAVFVQGEYQHAPAVPSDPASALQGIAAADLTPVMANGTPQIDRFRLLNSAVAFRFHNVQFSAGKQSAWWGPGESGALLMSDNAEPFPMLKIEQESPVKMPLLSAVLGPARMEFFIGQLSGQRWELDYPNVVGPNIAPQPFIHGEKISFKPTPNFEFGMGITAMFGGPGLPVTWANYFKTYYSHTSGYNDPAKRASAADFSYRIPGIRNWLTIYGDSLVVDEISPIGSTRATVNPGIYMPQIPKIPKLELRAEGIHEPLTSEFAPGFVYYGLRRYRSGYTNNGNLLGNWIGRAGRGGQGWLTYSFSPRNQIQCGYRLQEVSKDFLGGGRLVDYSAGGQFSLTSNLGVSGLLQYEQWWFPVLSPTQQSNVTASIQLTYHPSWRIRK